MTIGPEIAIVGGGVIGLMIARELNERGVKDITVLEKGRVGQEASWAAGGMLSPQAETDGPGPFLDMMLASRHLFAKLSDDLKQETGVDIELDRSGTFSLAFNDADLKKVSQRTEWQRASGLSAEMLGPDDLREAEPAISREALGAGYFPNDWQVDNRKLLIALARSLEIRGIKITEGFSGKSVVAEAGRVTGITTDQGFLAAEHVVLAAGAWTTLVELPLSGFDLRVEPVRGQIIMFEADPGMLKRVLYGPEGYLIPRLDGRVLAGSTSEHVGFDRSLTDEAASNLRAMAGRLVPGLADARTVDQWSGLRPFAPDAMPVLGSFGDLPGLTVATAHYRNGILLSPITSQQITGLILDGADSVYTELYGPERFQTRGLGEAA